MGAEYLTPAPPVEFDPRTLWPVASRYIVYAIQANIITFFCLKTLFQHLEDEF